MGPSFSNFFGRFSSTSSPNEFSRFANRLPTSEDKNNNSLTFPSKLNLNLIDIYKLKHTKPPTTPPPPPKNTKKPNKPNNKKTSTNKHTKTPNKQNTKTKNKTKNTQKKPNQTNIILIYKLNIHIKHVLSYSETSIIRTNYMKTVTF